MPQTRQVGFGFELRFAAGVVRGVGPFDGSEGRDAKVNERGIFPWGIIGVVWAGSCISPRRKNCWNAEVVTGMGNGGPMGPRTLLGTGCCWGLGWELGVRWGSGFRWGPGSRWGTATGAGWASRFGFVLLGRACSEWTTVSLRRRLWRGGSASVSEAWSCQRHY